MERSGSSAEHGKCMAEGLGEEKEEEGPRWGGLREKRVAGEEEKGCHGGQLRKKGPM